MSSSRRQPEPFTWALLTVGVVAASTSAILIRYAEDADPFAISFWRCAIGALALLPLGAARLRRIPRRGAAFAAASGLFLAGHFATWITSVRLTSVAASVLLVSTTPVFTAFAGRLFFGERLPRLTWAGIAVAIAGAGVVAGVDFAGSSPEGNILALAGAVTAGGYFMCGERSRRQLAIAEFAVISYTTSAVVMLLLVVIAGADLAGYGRATWWSLAGMVVGPQLLGHTVINFVLRDIDATTVAVVVMAEPVIAGSLALALFGEHPSASVYAGGAAILAGIYVVTASRRRGARGAAAAGLPA